jgi:hypothetical protein
MGGRARAGVAEFESLVQMLRAMKSQNQRTYLWEFNINQESPRAEFFHQAASAYPLNSGSRQELDECEANIWKRRRG